MNIKTDLKAGWSWKAFGKGAALPFTSLGAAGKAYAQHWKDAFK